MVTFWQVFVKLYNTGPVLILAFPLYASVTAIESPSKEDETQWLTYWVLYSLIQLVEIALDRVLVWIPILYSVKLAVVAWLVLPQFHGAAFVYDNYVKKYLPGIIPNVGGQNQKGGSKQRQGIDQISPQSQAAISNFIAEYGSSAFDRVIQAAVQALKLALAKLATKKLALAKHATKSATPAKKATPAKLLPSKAALTKLAPSKKGPPNQRRVRCMLC